MNSKKSNLALLIFVCFKLHSALNCSFIHLYILVFFVVVVAYLKEKKRVLINNLDEDNDRMTRVLF